jgi:hypothetical protein
LIDFTRASAGTFVNSAGNIVSTPASRNLLTFTQQFDNAAWTKGGTTPPTVTANSTVAPDGTLTADSIVQGAGTSSQSISQLSGNATIGLTYTWSCYLKEGGSRYVQMTFSSGGFGAVQYANIDLRTGSVTQSAGSPTVVITASGNGWYRVSYTATATATGAGTPFLVMINSPTDGRVPTITGSTSNFFYAWGAQLELGTTATDYTRNVGGLFPPRFDYDPVTRAPRGLLVEEQRTNLLLRSEEFDNASWSKPTSTVTANAAVSPDGTADADKVIVNNGTNLGTGSGAGVRQDISKAASAITYTLSVYAKAGELNSAILFLANGAASASARATFNLAEGTVGSPTIVGAFASASAAIFPVGNGWYRCRLTATSDTDTSMRDTIMPFDTVKTQGNGSDGVFLWGAQLEAGAFATSYIPTTSAQVTRSADIATITGANFSQFYNQSEGTFVVGFDVASTATASKAVVTTNDGTSNNINLVYVSTGARVFGQVRSGDSDQALLNVADITTNTATTVALAYKVNDFAAAVNGGAVTTDTSGAVAASQNALNIGYSSNYGGLYLNGHIRSIRYYPARLSNATLPSLTA